jgi:hypothetical protein
VTKSKRAGWPSYCASIISTPSVTVNTAGDLQVSAQPKNCRIMLAFVSITHSITIFPEAFMTAIEILS